MTKLTKVKSAMTTEEDVTYYLNPTIKISNC